MKITGSIPRKQRLASYRGRVMIDTVRGVLRVRKWPKKRGTPKSPLQRWWIDWFRQANLLAKYADGMAQARAIAMTKGSGLYPRDVMLKAMRGRLYIWADENGKVWYPMAAVQDISESLDVLAQSIGSVLVRATDRWRAPPAGAVDDVLTYKGPATSPIWAPPASAGGIAQTVLPGTPIIPDNSVDAYDLDVSIYTSVNVIFDTIGFAASTYPLIRFSIDGGATFKSGASDYLESQVNAASNGSQDNNAAFTSPANATVNHRGRMTISNLRASPACWTGLYSTTTSAAIVRAGLFAFDAPITDIRIFSNSGANFNAGTLHVIGER